MNARWQQTYSGGSRLEVVDGGWLVVVVSGGDRGGHSCDVTPTLIYKLSSDCQKPI